MIMSKTKRTSKLYRERQTAIQLEKMEPRQLLATVTGGGEEVGSDISYQGNVYDQVLMQGAAVSVEADPGQIVRVSWIDGNGDITQGEFSGSGTFTVSLDDFVEPAEPENYNQPGVEYASGHASITIEGSNSSSNVSVFTVGPTTSHNFGALDTGVDLDGVADIARITIVADPSQPGGSTFGGIRTANAMYSDDTGVVGIAADGVQVQSVVLIGDIDASNSGIPTLLFGDNSQFGTVQIAGGDLAQTNGEAINDGGFQTISFIDGMTSDGVLQPAGVIAGTFLNGEYRISSLDTSTEINIEGKSQAELDALFSSKTFTEDVTIVGDLASFRSITVAEFQKNVTFDGVYEGSIDLVSVGGDITFMGIAIDPEAEGAAERTNSSNITVGSLEGSLIFGSEMDSGDVNYTGTVMIPSMDEGAIQVYGDFTGMVTTDGTLGAVHVSGDFSGNAVGILGIGDITVGGNLTSGGTAFYTSSDDGQANIGSLTVMGDVDQDDGDSLIDIANNGSFGMITLMGGGTDVGIISIGGSLLGGSNGDISITGAGDVDVDSIELNEGALGHLTITGDGEGDLTLGDIAAGSIGNVTVSGFGTISLNDITVRTAGMLDFTGDTMVNGAITVGHQLGSLTINGDATINADITSAWMGDVMIDGNATFADGMGLVSGTGSATSGRLTSFEVTGNTTFDSTSGANIELAAGGDFTFGGTVSGTSDGVEIMASSLGDLSFTAALAGNQAVITDLTVRAIPGADDEVAIDGSNLGDYSIGNITVESTNTIGIPGASLFDGSNAFHALGAIGNISLVSGGSPTAQTPLLSADTDDLLFIVGNTTGNPADAPTIDFEGGTVSIGDVSIDVAPGSASDYNTIGFSGDPDATAAARFTGLNILAGVHASSADLINSVNDRIVDVADLKTNYDAAKETRDNLLGDNDPDELLADVTEAETALGTASVADAPDTADVDESKAATGTYVALEAAQAEVDAAEKVRDEAQAALVGGSEAASEIERLRLALGGPSVPEDPATTETEARDATGEYIALEAAQTAFNGDTSLDSFESALETAQNNLKTAQDNLKTAQDNLKTANDNLSAARLAHAAAVSARADSVISDSEYRTAFSTDRMSNYDLAADAAARIGLGRTAYVEKASDDSIVASAPGAWNALSDDEKTGLDGQGYESYNAADDLEAADSRIVWLGLSNAEKLAEGRAAWIADYISDTSRSPATDADEAGDTARATATTTAGTAFDRIGAGGTEDEIQAAQLAQALTSYNAQTARMVTANLAGFANNAARLEVFDAADGDGGLIAGLLAHVTTYSTAVSDATTALGIPDDPATPDPADEATMVYEARDDAQDALVVAETNLQDAKNEAGYLLLLSNIADAQADVDEARTAYLDALAAGTGETTQEDVIATITALTDAEKVRDAAQADVDKAAAALATAKDALPEGLAAAQTAYDEARAALEAVGVGSLGDDEILTRNDADLKGTIGDIDIRNKTTLLSATAVGDITDADDIILIGSASAIVAATDVGAVNGQSLGASKDGVLVGGDDSTLDEDELLVYIV